MKKLKKSQNLSKLKPGKILLRYFSSHMWHWTLFGHVKSWKLKMNIELASTKIHKVNSFPSPFALYMESWKLRYYYWPWKLLLWSINNGIFHPWSWLIRLFNWQVFSIFMLRWNGIFHPRAWWLLKIFTIAEKISCECPSIYSLIILGVCMTSCHIFFNCSNF